MQCEISLLKNLRIIAKDLDINGDSDVYLE